MALKKGSNVDRGYATVSSEDGINYREIADTMSELGYPMNHSSARNYVLRVMKKFVLEFASEYDLSLDSSKIDEIAKSPTFQSGITDILHAIELERRSGRAYL